MTYSDDEKSALLKAARDSIAHGLLRARPLLPDHFAHSSALQQFRATFVTLKINDDLRGCIGTLAARAPLIVDAAEHAFAAAFEDPRFPSLTETEFKLVALAISILSPAEPLPVRDESDLIAKIRPGIDGLILSDGKHRSTFLPSVWEDLPEPRDFLRQLKRKAGLRETHWSASMRFERYQTEQLSETK